MKPKTKREPMPAATVAVMRSFQVKQAADMAKVVEASFRLGHHMGRKEGLNITATERRQLTKEGE